MHADAYANEGLPARVAYDFLADTYDDRALPRTVKLADVLHRSGLLEGALVLDLGVGTGLLWGCLDSIHGPARIVGVDSSSGMLMRARSRRNPRLDLVRADFAQLPFAIQTFDVILLSFSARHSPELTPMLARAVTRLVGNGHVVLMEYSGETQLALAGAVMRCYSLLVEAKERPAEVATSYFSACPDDVLLSAATAAGLRIKELDYVCLVEAAGCESVVDFVVNSPPVAFDLIRYGRSTHDRVRSRLLADHILPGQIASKILICVMDRPDGG